MSKAATITELEHRIETLPPMEQFKLLEKMVRHLKHSFLQDQPKVRQSTTVTKKSATARGLLKQYADPALREQEKEGFLLAMREKHTPR